MNKGFIKYIIIIAVILIAVFVSQSAYFKQWSQNAFKKAVQPAGSLMKGASWPGGKIASQISGEVQKRGQIIQNEVSQEKKNVSENILQRTENYFSGIANSIFHPGIPQNCQPSQTVQLKTQTN